MDILITHETLESETAALRPAPPGLPCPGTAELPAVGLYLDQTVQFVNGCFRTFRGVELTPSMVSNYVKKGIHQPPRQKEVHPGSARLA